MTAHTRRTFPFVIRFAYALPERINPHSSHCRLDLDRIPACNGCHGFCTLHTNEPSFDCAKSAFAANCTGTATPTHAADPAEKSTQACLPFLRRQRISCYALSHLRPFGIDPEKTWPRFLSPAFAHHFNRAHYHQRSDHAALPARSAVERIGHGAASIACAVRCAGARGLGV